MVIFYNTWKNEIQLTKNKMDLHTNTDVEYNLPNL